MNKSIKILIGLLLIIVIIMIYFTIHYFSVDKDITLDERKFKKEYERFNGKKNKDKDMLSVNIPVRNNVIYASEKDVIKYLSKGTSVLYFGFPECPWCRNLVPEVISVNREYNLSIYYANLLSIRDKKHLDKDNNIIVDQEGSAEYYKILELLGDNASIYEGLGDDSIKRIYFPTLVFVKNGKVIGTYEGTIPSQKDPYVGLTEKQKKEIHKKLEKYFDEVSSSVCDINKAC